MPALVLLAILLTPILEILGIVLAVNLVGGWWTLAALLATTALGGWITRREGRRAWRALQGAVQGGAPAERELSDAALVLAGGLLLLAPGFLTDIAGLVLMLPFTRPLLRRPLAAYGERRIREAEAQVFPPGMTRESFAPYAARADQGPSGRVVQGEVVQDDDVPK
ncbi:FxsA family protein [Actinomadura sp. 21ATH]|uniref:FxsA family protein n=1 Tax=Actinomadura sp. 21ATH TaxID=1735444 RepID=UPI0035C1440C